MEVTLCCLQLVISTISIAFVDAAVAQYSLPRHYWSMRLCMLAHQLPCLFHTAVQCMSMAL